MNNNIVSSVIVLVTTFSGDCLALIPIAERFTANTVDPIRWYQYNSGAAMITQSSGLMNFVVPSNPTMDAFASLELLASQPGFNESWQMILDLSDTTNEDKGTGIGFMIFNSADRGDSLYVEFYGPKGVSALATSNFKPVTKTLSARSTISGGSVRVRFDKTTKLMSFSVSKPKSATGYKWLKVGTFSPTGKNGNVNANWRMNSTSGKFGINLIAFSTAKTIKAGKLTIDNFTLSALP